MQVLQKKLVRCKLLDLNDFVLPERERAITGGEYLYQCKW